MRNTTIIFIFFGVVLAAALIFAFIYLPKMADASGIAYKNIVLALPVDMTNMRYYDKGISSFCVDKNNGIDLEVKTNTPVLAPVSGVIENIYEGPNRITIQPETNVLISVSPIVKLNVAIGDYVNSGDVLGYSESTNVHLILDNQKNDRYECPYLYLNEQGKQTISTGLTLSSDNSGKICECDSIRY